MILVNFVIFKLNSATFMCVYRSLGPIRHTWGKKSSINSLVVPEEAAGNLINCPQVALWVMHQAVGFEK